MEISSIPFLNQEEYSYFYSFFQEVDSNNNNNNTHAEILNKKRRRIDSADEVESSDPLREILSTFSFLYPEGNSELEQDRKWDTNNNNNTHADILNKKRRRIDSADEVESSDPLKEILSTFSFLYPEGNSEPEQDLKRDFDFQEPNSVFEFNPESRAMNQEIVETDEVRAQKCPRQSDVAAAAPSGYSNQYPSGGGGGSSGQQRRLWVKDRSSEWWERYNSDDCPDEEFRKVFRMSKATFNMICDELDPAVTKKDTMLRLAIPVRQRVAVCIYRLATGEPLRSVSALFGLGISTCHKLVLEVCAAIRIVLFPKYIQWPDGTRMEQIKTEFESLSGIPNVGGSMYTTHISIIAPKVRAASYFNKKHTEKNQKPSYSTTVQGVVDSRGVFTSICIGGPGSLSDETILEKSSLRQIANQGLVKDVWVVGNSGHPLMDWVLVPYTHPNLTWSQHAFNEKIGDIQSVAKNAFVKLKGRWSCLQKRTEVKLQDLPDVLGACCVLHNICEMRNEEMDLGLRFDLFDDETVAENSVRASAIAVQARDNIAHNLLHHNLGGNAFN